jgi:hypothetical protein
MPEWTEISDLQNNMICFHKEAEIKYLHKIFSQVSEEFCRPTREKRQYISDRLIIDDPFFNN